jgi:predicted TIM-barrel fold metal-dependent hydrolase
MKPAADPRPISADSHIIEPPNCFLDHIDPKFRERAPRLVPHGDNGAEKYVIEGFANPIGLNVLAAAGKKPEEIQLEGDKFESIHRGGWDGKARIAEQERDGVAGEFIYPTIGMLMCNLDDADYKNACMHAYNKWLQEYVGADPKRLFALGQTAVRSVEEAIKDFELMKAMGFKGVMMPGRPATEFDYDDPRFDPLWRASVDLELPISFHILTSSKDMGWGARGPSLNGFQGIIRGCQDIIGMFIYGGVFMRNPELKLVCVEADAGWAPHYIYRMDHAYKRHRFWRKSVELDRMPSEYFLNNVYMTFQDDWVAFQTVNMVNPKRLMWANDFPHSDSTWPWSQEMLAEQTKHLTKEQADWILRDNVRELYKLD